MGARDLLNELLRAGLTVDSAGGLLVVRPGSRLTAEQRTALRACKDQMLALIASRDAICRLTPEQADRAHATPWDDADVERFVGRMAVLMRRGVASSAELAERLHLRDVDLDDRRLCLECVHLEGQVGAAWHCADARRAQVGNPLADELVQWLQRCPAFKPAPIG